MLISAGVYKVANSPPRRGGGIKCKVTLMGKKMQGWGEKNSRRAEKIKGKNKKKGKRKEKNQRKIIETAIKIQIFLTE